MLIRILFIALVLLKSSSNLNACDMCRYMQVKGLTSSVVSKTDTMSCGDYTFKIFTWFLKDSVSNEERHMFFPVCIKQEIYLYKQGNKLKQLDYRVRSVTQRLVSGQRIKMLENVITEIGFLEGSKGTLFVVNGYGGCNSCSEIYSVYSLDGNLLYFLYQEADKELRNVGNLKNVLSSKGISEKEYSLEKYRKKSIYYELVSH